MKRKTAKEILAESFQELAAGKDIDKITVKDITDNCGYSPATFYRQFKDKYDLIAWEFPEIYEVFSREEEPDEEAKRQKSHRCTSPDGNSPCSGLAACVIINRLHVNS